MSDSLSKLEKRTAYTLVLPAVLLVFAIVLFPIFANVWISFKDIELKDIRIPEPRAKKIVKTVSGDENKIKILYKYFSNDFRLLYCIRENIIFRSC